MRKLLKLLLKVGALLGTVAVVIRGIKLFDGSPPDVGTEDFSFSGDDDPYEIDESTLGGDVNPELIERLVCPLDKGPLDYVDGKWLVNRRNGFRYPITDGIPVMLVEVGERYRDESLITEADGEPDIEADGEPDIEAGGEPDIEAGGEPDIEASRDPDGEVSREPDDGAS